MITQNEFTDKDGVKIGAMGTLDYAGAANFMFSRLDYSRTHQQNIAPENFDLKRVRRLMDAAGSPHEDYPIIHIAGTKGKGSTAAIAASMLRCAGFKTGLYTSPHLQDYRERFVINGQTITPQAFVAQVERLIPLAQSDPALTLFELEACLAFSWFASHAIEVGVIEVGLGGRLDATNVVSPAVSVITPISFDHMGVLGHRLSEIAAEKAGIIKPGIPVVLGTQPEAAMRKLQSVAATQQAPVFRVDHEIVVGSRNADLRGQDIRWTINDGPPRSAPLGWTRLALVGHHQAQNAAAAGMAVHLLSTVGVDVSAAAIPAGLEAVRWPGRFEVLNDDPVLILDSAHNAESALRLFETLQETLPGRRGQLAFAALQDKDALAMLQTLTPLINVMHTASGNHPRSYLAAELIEIAQVAGMGTALHRDLETAFEAAWQATKSNQFLLITGSLTTVGEAKRWWSRRVKSD